jgi:hypothetical protein
MELPSITIYINVARFQERLLLAGSMDNDSDIGSLSTTILSEDEAQEVAQAQAEAEAEAQAQSQAKAEPTRVYELNEILEPNVQAMLDAILEDKLREGLVQITSKAA